MDPNQMVIDMEQGQEEAPFEEPPQEKAIFGLGQQGEKGPIQEGMSSFKAVCCIFCLGIAVFPLCTYWNGYNEKSNVCAQGGLAWISEYANSVDCTFNGAESPVFFSCPILPVPTSQALDVFQALNTQASVGDGLTGSIMSYAPSVTQSVQVLQCIPSTVNNRTTYSIAWSSALVTGADGKCMTGRANQWPSNLSPGSHTSYAPAIPVGDFSLPQNLFSGRLPPSTPWSFNSSDPRFGAKGTLYKPGNPVTLKTLWPMGSSLYACNDSSAAVLAANIGCVKISLAQNTDKYVSIIGGISSSMQVQSVKTPKTWLCSGSNYFSLKVGQTTLNQAVDDAYSQLKSQTWGIRFAVTFGTCLAIFCCLYPLLAAVECVGYFISYIPCGIGDCIAGFMESVACIFNSVLSCCCGTAWSLLVMGIVWVAVRPTVAIFLLLAGMLLFCFGAGAAYISRRREGKSGGVLDQYVDKIPCLSFGKPTAEGPPAESPGLEPVSPPDPGAPKRQLAGTKYVRKAKAAPPETTE